MTADDSRERTGQSTEGAMDTVLQRIAAWQAAGLIDAATADRLRAAEAAEPASDPEPAAVQARPSGVASAAGSFFGPTPTIVEMFGYLGAIFLIGAWSTFLTRIAGSADTTNGATILTLGSALSSAVLLGIAFVLRAGDARRRRAGGAAVLAATVAAAAAGGFAGVLFNLDATATSVLAAAVALVVATIGRVMLPGVTTQAAVLFALTGLAWSILNALKPQGDEFDPFAPAGDVLRFVVLPAIAWLVVAIGLGVLGLYESRTSGAPAQRRAGLTRFWAGLVAVAGVATSVFTSGSLGNGEYGRLLEPWIGELAVLLVSLVLVERAFRRESSAYIFAAAIGLITALTDFNFRYLTDSVEVGLLVEGLILIGAGVAADRVRRRIERSRKEPPDGAAPLEPAPLEAGAPTA